MVGFCNPGLIHQFAWLHHTSGTSGNETWSSEHIYIVYTYNIYEVSESPTHISTVGTNRAGASTWAERSMTNVGMIISSCLCGRWGLKWSIFLMRFLYLIGMWIGEDRRGNIMKDTCLKEIGLCFEISIIALHSTMNTIGRTCIQFK